MAANKVKIVFCRGVYLAENTSQAASVEFVPYGGQIMRAADCKNLSESPEGGFRQSGKAPGVSGGLRNFYISCLPSRALERVTSSAYSSWLPTGTP